LTMDVFGLHQHVISEYATYTKSFIKISDTRIAQEVERQIKEGLLWPYPLIQLNPSFEPGSSIDDLCTQEVLHDECARIFRIKEHENDLGRALILHRHQAEAARIARRGLPYVLTTGTGSGKSLCYIIPIVDHILRSGTGKGIQAIIVYPMNALANSQVEELDKFLKRGYPEGKNPVTYRRYTGQEGRAERESILRDPPDILLTNYVMLELILTRIEERPLVNGAKNLRFLVLDELHTYRGRQGADVSMLVRRCRESFNGKEMLCVGTSATMASEGDSQAQSLAVADVATKIFGQTVSAGEVIAETLVRATQEFDVSQAPVLHLIRQSAMDRAPLPIDYQTLCANPLAGWIESTFGLRRETTTGRLIRQIPLAVRGPEGAAAQLSALLEIPIETAEAAIERYLLAGSQCRKADSPYPLFAFRLHQFITRGDTVWCTLEPEEQRYLTLRGQQFMPGNRDRALFPLVFCRHCGQEYYSVERPTQGNPGPILPRDRFNGAGTENHEPGYLYMSAENPWPEGEEEELARVPESFIETRPDGRRRIRPRQPVPEVLRLSSGGSIEEQGIQAAFVPTPFRFCLNPKCRIAYNPRQRSDVMKLGTIGIDGRSTATSILALTTILRLRHDDSLEPMARKLLSFTDNRQDASLQAGHFNDFVEVGLVRSALLRALLRHGKGGLRYDELSQHVERGMDLGVQFYANDPDIRGPALEETRRALRSVLSYFLYRDLQRGWRVTSPNLEECGLLQIDYLGTDDLAADTKFWSEKQAFAALIAASPEQRKEIICALLDHLRRSLAIKEDSLTPIYQERIALQSSQRLCDPWIIEEHRDMETACIAWPRGRVDRDRGDDIFLSAPSNFGLYLKRPGVLPSLGHPLSQTDITQLIEDLFRGLKTWGLIEEVRSPAEGQHTPGYQVPASVMIWKAGDGSKPMVDRLRITQAGQTARQANSFFVTFYKTFADFGAGLEAREHTAQVPSDVRREREQEFRIAELPVLFCSPTMELGVDIAQLNVVNMRNVPPTPANYAQRSGRAGRGGQPAFVYTYCSGFSPHDRYYFQQPHAMVAGQVSPPRLDLLNRDLIQSHIHAVWLSEAELNLGTTLAELLIVSEANLNLPLNENVRKKIESVDARFRALARSRKILDAIGPELKTVPWYRADWLDDVMARIPQTFDAACERWRGLYRAAVQQRRTQNEVIGDHTRSAADRERAKRLRGQAEAQIQLLTSAESAKEGDFYSYRYFASEGFLPGYNFPRLPVSAFIPARRGRRGKDEFLSRPRFLAISEFGPRAVVYHEGAQYRINKVTLAFDNDENQLTKLAMKVCNNCGYGHKVIAEPGPDVCQNCGKPLLPTCRVDELVRMQNVTAKRADRITSDEEERQRIGYELQTTFRFGEVDGRQDIRTAEVQAGDAKLAILRYGDAASIWRINLGWVRRAIPSQRGFLLDTERGYWATNRDLDQSDAEDPLSERIERVVPYVEDRRNVLVIQFEPQPNLKTMASIQSALKESIQKLYQLEPGELAADPLPNRDDRRLIFMYESAEGGAGVLRDLVENPEALPRIARSALEICHFDPDTGADLGPAAARGFGCEAACYDCLLDYGNQMDHRNLDRKLIVELLQSLAKSTVVVGAAALSRSEQMQKLWDRCDSELERRWLKLIESKRLSLPTDGQYLITSCSTRPDFYYADAKAAVFIDGPPHDTAETKAKDIEITERLIDAGYIVIRFHHQQDWEQVFTKYRDVFGG